MEIKIASEFSRFPGPRDRGEGDYSAEDFLERLLLPRFNQSRERGERLTVYLDGTAGYATSFLEGSFGKLQRDVKSQGVKILDHIDFVSEEEPYLIDEIKEYVGDALKG